jgi:hypothetical protein
MLYTTLGIIITAVLIAYTIFIVDFTISSVHHIIRHRLAIYRARKLTQPHWLLRI